MIPTLTDKVIGYKGCKTIHPYPPWCYSEKYADTPHLPRARIEHWDKGVNKAVCHINSASAHVGNNAIPGDRCSCGFYAYHSLAGFKSISGYGYIKAAVLGHGKLRVTADGWRAEYAEIAAFALDYNAAESEIRDLIEKTSNPAAKEQDLLNNVERYIVDLSKYYNVPLLEYDMLEEYGNEVGIPVPKEFYPVSTSRPATSSHHPVLGYKVNYNPYPSNPSTRRISLSYVDDKYSYLSKKAYLKQSSLSLGETVVGVVAFILALIIVIGSISLIANWPS